MGIETIKDQIIPFTYQIARNGIAGCTGLNKFGQNDAIGAVEETIWSKSNLYTYLAAAEILQITSNHAEDDSAGVGAQTVRIFGLDANWNKQTEIVALNGGGDQATVNSYIRIFRMKVVTAGANGKNTGIVEAKNNAGAVVLGQIDAGLNQTLMTLWSVPLGKTFYLTNLYASESANKATVVRLYVREFGGIFQVKRTMIVNDNHFHHILGIPLVVLAKSDIEVRAITGGGGGGSVTSGFDGWYE